MFACVVQQGGAERHHKTFQSSRNSNCDFDQQLSEAMEVKSFQRWNNNLMLYCRSQSSYTLI